MVSKSSNHKLRSLDSVRLLGIVMSSHYSVITQFISSSKDFSVPKLIPDV